MTEKKIRSLLYEGSDLHPLFNPMKAQGDEIPSPLVIDMTVDIANHGRLYHNKTEEVRELMAQAGAIVTDSERMAQLARKYTRGLVVSAPWGWTTARDKEASFTIGLLNYNEEQEITNKQLRKFFKGLKQPLLVYGQPLDWFDGGDNRATEDWDQFAGDVDVLLLVGSQHVIPSMTLPISAMMSGAVVLATKDYSLLSPASGVMIIPNLEPKIWAAEIKKFEQNLRRLDTLKMLNANYARQISKESQGLIFRLARRLT